MILRRPSDLGPASAATGRSKPTAPERSLDDASRFDVTRLTDNELVLFDRPAHESWIVYPPRSAYDHLRRPSRATVLVEHHPWAPYCDVTVHAVRIEVGCEEHGLECRATAAIQAGVDLGWNPSTLARLCQGIT